MAIVDVETGEIVPDLSEDEYLEALASRVREEHRNVKLSLTDALEGYFVIGQCLNEARQALPSNEAYGAWFSAQQFGFSTQWGLTLRSGALNEPLVRRSFETQVSNGNTSVNFKQAVQQAIGTGKPKPPKKSKPDYKALAAQLAEVLRDLEQFVGEEAAAAISDALAVYDMAVAS